MDKIKHIISTILYPKWFILFLTTLISIIGLFYVFTNDNTYSFVEYLIYIVAFYSLLTIIMYLIKTIPGFYKSLYSKISSDKYVVRYQNDFTFRTKVLLYSALLINLVFVFSKMITGILYNSIWFIVLGIYYLLLVIIRIRLVVFTYVNQIKVNLIAEHKQAIRSSLTLLLINGVLIFILIFIIIYGETFVFPGVFIYLMAAYTMYAVIGSIVSMAKYKKFKSPIMSTSRIVSLAAALIMLLGLETAMLAEFNGGVNNQNFNNIMIGCTGIVIAITILCLSMYKIIKSAKILTKIKNDSNHLIS